MTKCNMSSRGRKPGGIAWNKGLDKSHPIVKKMVEKSAATRKERGIKPGNTNHFQSKYELQLKPYLQKQGYIHNYRYSLAGTEIARNKRISYFQIDFFNPVTEHVFEIHGDEHFTSMNQKNKDNVKKHFFLDKGFTYVEMSNKEAQGLFEIYKEKQKVPQIVEKEIQFDYGHRLSSHSGQCRFIHGHRAKVIVAVEGHLIAETGVSSKGMVVDLKKIKEIATMKIHDILDHGFAVYEGDRKMIEFLKQEKQKYIVMKEVPTAENLAKWCFNQIKQDIEQQYENVLNLKFIKFFETPNSTATYHE